MPQNCNLSSQKNWLNLKLPILICILSFDTKNWFFLVILNNFVLQKRSARFPEEFKVRDDRMGLAIGTHGANIHQGRKIEGVLNVEPNEVNIE